MSWWTDVFLAVESLEEVGPSDGPVSFPAIDFINTRLLEVGPYQLFQVQDPRGSEYQAPSFVFMMTAKCCGKQWIIDAVKSAPWEYPEAVQLFLRDEDDHGFEAVILGLK